MFKFENSFLIFKLAQLFDQPYVSERSNTTDLVARLTEIKSFGERSELMARLQRDLPTYIAAANGFSIDHGDVGDFIKGIQSWQKNMSLKSGPRARRPVSPSPWRQILWETITRREAS